jgi:hypothetical protein
LLWSHQKACLFFLYVLYPLLMFSTK